MGCTLEHSHTQHAARETAHETDWRNARDGNPVRRADTGKTWSLPAEHSLAQFDPEASVGVAVDLDFDLASSPSPIGRLEC